VGGSSGLVCEIPFAYGDRDVCVSRVVDYSSLVMHGRIPLYLGNMNINRWELTYALGVSVFPFFPVLSPGGCESMWLAALTVVFLCAVSLCVAGFFTVITVRFCYTVDWVFLFTVCSWFFHCIVGVHCKALVLLIGVILRIAIPLQ